MKTAIKVSTVLILTPVILLALYIAFLWATYIDETILTGSKYGFSIDSTKEQTYADIAKIKQQNPQVKVYISYGQLAGDYLILSPSKENYKEISKYDRWELLLDGEGEFFNTIGLYFQGSALTEIYRHRKYFEAP